MSDYRDDHTPGLKRVGRASSLSELGPDDGAPARRSAPKVTFQRASQKPRIKAPRQERPENRKAVVWRVIGISLFSIAIIVLIILAVGRPGASNSIKSGYVQQGVLERSAEGQGIFLRKETLVSTGTGGKVIADINEGERVAKGEVVAYVVDEAMEGEVEELKKIEDRILSAQVYSDSMTETISASLVKVSETVINDILADSAHRLKGSLRDFTALRSDVETSFTLQNDLSMDITSKDEYMQSLLAKRAEVNARLEGHMYALKAPEAGVVSYTLDGNEGTSSTLDYENLTISQLSPFKSNGTRTLGSDVKSGQPVFRITSSDYYYVAVTVPASAAENINKNDVVTIQAKNRSFKAKATVMSVSEAGDRYLVVLRSSSNMATTISYRLQDVEVIFESVTGMKIPVRALSDWDSAGITAKIKVIRSNVVEGIYVKVLSHDDEYAIVSNNTSFDDESGVAGLKLNDMYVLNPESVTEGQLTK